jgi:hypothetical protein
VDVSDLNDVVSNGANRLGSNFFTSCWFRRASCAAADYLARAYDPGASVVAQFMDEEQPL